MNFSRVGKQLIRASVLFTLGLGGGSTSGVDGETPSAVGSVSQTSKSERSITSKLVEDNLSPIIVSTYFDFDSAALSIKTTMILYSAVDKSAENPSALVVISGHADERGTREYNLAL